MSLLAHATRAGRPVAQRNLDKEIREETREARRIRAQLGCTWAEALRIVRKGHA